MLAKSKSKSYSGTPKLYSAHKTEAAHDMLRLPTIILPLLTIVLLTSLNILPASALTYQDEVDLQFTWNPTVNISLSGDLIISNLSPGSSSDSNIITVTAGSNDSHGYTLYSTVGNTTNSSTELRLDGTSTSNIFSSVTGNKAALTNFDDNTWGYSYCDYTSNANACDTALNWVSGNAGSTTAGYNGLPLYSVADSSRVKLADTSSANQTTIKFKIGAKAANTQAVGTYTNTVNFIGVGKVLTTNYTLNYNGNGADTGTTPSSQSGSTTDGVITLSNSSPTKTDYIFNGWCDTDNTSDPTTCSGNTYEPGRIYIIPAASQGGTVTVNMYAIWESAAIPTSFADAYAVANKTQSGDYYTMQDMGSSICQSVTEGQTALLKDTRDGKTYNVAKLADGNCWMTQNLDHDIKTDGTVTYDSTTTDISSAWSPSTATYATGTTTWDNSTTAPESYDPGDLCWNSTLDENYETTLSNGTTACGNDKHYHIGNYYNWTAAVAMNDSSSYATDNQEVDQSICPAGWRLPIGTGSKSIQNLDIQLDLDSVVQYSPVYFVYGGHWVGSSKYVGSVGTYWSSVVGDSIRSRCFDFSADGSFAPQNTAGRYHGFSVRCVAR